MTDIPKYLTPEEIEDAVTLNTSIWHLGRGPYTDYQEVARTMNRLMYEKINIDPYPEPKPKERTRTVQVTSSSGPYMTVYV